MGQMCRNQGVADFVTKCLLFPKAEVQTARIRGKLGAAFGQKRSFGLTSDGVVVSVDEVGRKSVVHAGPVLTQRPTEYSPAPDPLQWVIAHPSQPYAATRPIRRESGTWRQAARQRRS